MVRGSHKMLRAGLLLIAACHAAADSDRLLATEDRVRAAFLYQVAQFVEWPDSASTPPSRLRFCLLAADGLHPVLEHTVQGRVIGGRSIEVSRVDGAADAATCHLLYVGLTDRNKLQRFLAQWSFPPILLVGETDEFAVLGGMAKLSVEGGKVTFELNPSSAEAAGLRFRSQLLRFARIVRTGGGK